jgi:hypothetical protein
MSVHCLTSSVSDGRSIVYCALGGHGEDDTLGVYTEFGELKRCKIVSLYLENMLNFLCYSCDLSCWHTGNYRAAL